MVGFHLRPQRKTSAVANWAEGWLYDETGIQQSRFRLNLSSSGSSSSDSYWKAVEWIPNSPSFHSSPEISSVNIVRHVNPYPRYVLQLSSRSWSGFV